MQFNYKFVSGRVILSVDDQTQNGVVMDTELYRCHPRFDKNKITNDICLMKLAQRVDFNERIRTVALPYESEEKVYQSFEHKGWIKMSGFGSTLDRNDNFNKMKLRAADLRILDDHICWNQIGKSYNFSSQICTRKLWSIRCAEEVQVIRVLDWWPKDHKMTWFFLEFILTWRAIISATPILAFSPEFQTSSSGSNQTWTEQAAIWTRKG